MRSRMRMRARFQRPPQRGWHAFGELWLRGSPSSRGATWRRARETLLCKQPVVTRPCWLMWQKALRVAGEWKTFFFSNTIYGFIFFLRVTGGMGLNLNVESKGAITPADKKFTLLHSCLTPVGSHVSIYRWTETCYKITSGIWHRIRKIVLRGETIWHQVKC